MHADSGRHEGAQSTANGLDEVYGDRLHAVILHGSQVAGDAAPESDMDVLVVLNMLDSYWVELERTSSLSLDAHATVNVSSVSLAAWESADSTLMRHFRATGLAA